MFKLFTKILSAGLILWTGISFAEEGVNIFNEPRKAPIRAFTHQSGQHLKFSDFKGDFVLAHFWSRDCGPCVRELKTLNTFYNDMAGKGIRLVLLSPSGEWRSANEQKRFLKKYGAPDVPFYTDDGGRLAGDFGIFSRPHTVLINQQGEEIGRIRGSAKWNDPRVEEYIAKLKLKNFN